MSQQVAPIPSSIRTLSSPIPVSPSPPAAAAVTAMVRSPSAASKPQCAAFQSHPTDLELVNSYLRPWVETGLKAGPFIHEADVYAADPADLTRQFSPAVAQDGERAWYFFTPLRHKSVRGKRKARTVASGGGCWHNEAKSKPVFTGINGKRQIGHRQSFSFVKKDGGGSRIRTGWLMMELRLLKDGAAAGKGAQAEGALGNLVLCKVYRSPRNPEPGDRDPAPSSALKEEAAAADDDDDGSSAATAEDDDDSSDAPQATAAAAAASGPTKKSDEEEDSSEATVAAPSRHSKADDEISVSGAAAAAAPGRKEKASVGDEDSAETSAAAPPSRKRKAPDAESSGAAAPPAPAPKRSSASPGAPAPPPSTELECPHCGNHLVVTLKKPETKSETEIAKDVLAPGASDAPPARREARGSSEKDLQFHLFL